MDVFVDIIKQIETISIIDVFVDILMIIDIFVDIIKQKLSHL